MNRIVCPNCNEDDFEETTFDDQIECINCGYLYNLVRSPSDIGGKWWELKLE